MFGRHSAIESIGVRWPIFSTKDGGYVEPQNIYNGFKVLLEQAGLPDMRFHDLRHSAISIWLAMGINPKVVQELAGHSDIRITMNVYGHVFPGMHGRAMDDFDQWFKSTDPE
ncbi:MAG TPA: site-specific integrase [Ktedonosporobacter sp.]|nr:site-specific integrase [Ktedonosporobacter sp.]